MKTKLSKIVVFSTILATINITASAQGVTISSDSQDIRFVGNTYPKVQGSPYLNSDWEAGTVTLKNGTVLKDLSLKYDQIKDELMFQSEAETPMTFDQPVKEFSIKFRSTKGFVVKIFQNGFPTTDGTDEKGFYEILANGKTKLVKRTVKKIVEERGAGTILVTKQVQENIKYYLLSDDVLKRIKKDKNSLLSKLNKSEVDSFIKTNNLSVKNDEDLIKVIDYYNTL